ncbi:MAG: DUF4012 domain-containing protein [Acidimicrobiales bacterium]
MAADKLAEDTARGVAGGERVSTRRRHRSRRKRRSQIVVAILAIAAAAGGATAGCHPTGTPVVDPLYTAALAATVTVATSKARRSTWLILSAIAVALSKGLLLAPAIVALGVAFGSAFPRRSRQRIGALVGALAIQVVLRWPHVGFQGLTALVAAVAIGFPLVSALRQMSKRTRRRTLRLGLGGVIVLVVLAIPAAIGGLLAKNPVQLAIANTEGALASVSNGGTASGTAKLATATANLSLAHSRAASLWSAGSRLVPIVAQQREAIAKATGTAQGLTTAAKTEASTVDVRSFGSVNGHLDLAAISAAGGPLRALSAQITDARATLGGLRSGWLVAPIASRLSTFDTQLTNAGRNVNLGAQIVQAAPGLLGGNGTRHYFVAFMTPAEARGLDGFIGSFAELTVDQGSIRLTRAGPIAELNAHLPPGGRKLTGLGDYLGRYGSFGPADHFQDVSYSPDFPTVANAITQLYPQAGGDHIDGVLGLDPYGLAALLHFTGPIAVPGLLQPLTEANAADELLKGQYDTFNNGQYAGTTELARHDFLQDALSLSFAKLVHSSLPGPAALSAALDPQVRKGRFLFWSNHPSDQPLLRRLSLDGSFPQVRGGDVLALTTQNAAANKIDPYLSRRLDDRVTVDPATGHVHALLTVTLHNEAPATGLPPDVLGSFPSFHLPNGTNRTWLSIYSPFGLTGATQDGTPINMGSAPEFGVNAYSAYINVPAEGTVSLAINLVGQVQAGHNYTMAVRNQPMSIPDHDTMTVKSTQSGATTDSASWMPGPEERAGHRFSFTKP